MSEKINNPLKMPLRMADSYKNEPRSVSTIHKLIAMNPYLHAATSKNTRQAYQADIRSGRFHVWGIDSWAKVLR